MSDERATPAEAETSPIFGRDRAVLVIDGDAVSRRFIELTLRKVERCRVEAVNDGAAALDVLGNTLIDMVISESALRDMTGRQLLERLADDIRLRDLPTMFISADPRTDLKVELISAGAVDYLTKPCNRDELRARVARILHSTSRRGEHRNYVLAGDFVGMSFPEVISLLEMARRTGVLSILAPESSGHVQFTAGKVSLARFGNLSGPNAFYRMMAEPRGQFEFVPDRQLAEPDQSSAFPSATALLMEGARLLDHWNAARDTGASTMFSQAVGDAERTPSPALIATAPIARTDAAAYEQPLADPYTLAELLVLDEEELARWTARNDGRGRVHVILVADPLTAVSMMAAVASPLTSRELARSLHEGKKALSVVFRFRRERTLDLVLVDIERPAALLASLHRSPSLCILAPQRGDFFSISISARVELDALLAKLAPTALLAIGNPAMESRIHELQAGRVAARCKHAVFGQGDADLRTCLIEGLRFSGEVTDRFLAELANKK